MSGLVSSIGFVLPELLWALLALPVIWWLLQATPPAPVRRLFPAVGLLLGLKDEESERDKTPWWLLLLRLTAVAALIIAFSGPLLNPDNEADSDEPILILFDGGWTSAQDWPAFVEYARSQVLRAAQESRTVAVVSLQQDEEPRFQAARVWLDKLDGLSPVSWIPGFEPGWVTDLPESLETIWLTDGLDHPGRRKLLDNLRNLGPLRVVQPSKPHIAIHSPVFSETGVVLSADRSGSANPAAYDILAFGTDPNGIQRVVATSTAAFGPGETRVDVDVELPFELRNRLQSFEISGVATAGAKVLTDDRLKRPRVALIGAGTGASEAVSLLSQNHFLTRALSDSAEVIQTSLAEALKRNPRVIILADIPNLSSGETASLTDFLRKGGQLLRFAGDRTAADEALALNETDLMPVRLRQGGRSLGGALTWDDPKGLRAFEPDTPFFGLKIPADIRIYRQVIAVPGPTLNDRTVASLSDGTPLVTQKKVGLGQVTFFHITANAEWSNLPLSGLFVDMLERLSIAPPPQRPDEDDMAGTTWTASATLDGFGVLTAVDAARSVAGSDLLDKAPGPEFPAGLYDGDSFRLAVNAFNEGDTFTNMVWPQDVTITALETPTEVSLKPHFLTAALVMLVLDTIASLVISGRLGGSTRTSSPGTFAILAAIAVSAFHADRSFAQDGEKAIAATRDVVFAYVMTGDSETDRAVRSGLEGLGHYLTARTAIEPGSPIGIDIETDELSFYPLIYWPVTPDQSLPSLSAYEKLNRFLRSGGFILFDTRDAGLTSAATGSRSGAALRLLAIDLDIPPLEVIPDDHVLTRAFYLLNEFPGRYSSREVWVEASRNPGTATEGAPFRNLNDNVSPVMIGGNDWAAAWATDENGQPLYPVGYGNAGARQREMAIRFGINLAMHVLTGNYKSDQVHVPALLQRLGQ